MTLQEYSFPTLFLPAIVINSIDIQIISSVLVIISNHTEKNCPVIRIDSYKMATSQISTYVVQNTVHQNMAAWQLRKQRKQEGPSDLLSSFSLEAGHKT
jgi:hypothetical protein